MIVEIGGARYQLSERQARMLEARQLCNEDEEFRHQPLSWIAQDRRGYALYKDRWAEIFGLLGQKGGWDIDCMPVADFGNVNAGGALTIRSGFNTFPLANPAMSILKSPDPLPNQEPGGTLAAASGDRQIGTSVQPIVILLGCYVVHATSAAAVYQPAGTTFNLRVLSSAAAVGGAFTTLATLNVTTAANFVDQAPIVGTTGRTVNIEGGSAAAAAAIFTGDSLFGELVIGGVLNIQSNLLYAMLELA